MWFRRRGLFSGSAPRGGEIGPEDVLLDAINLEAFDTDRLEGRIEAAIGRTPFVFGLLIVFLGLALLLGRAVYLQIVHGSDFRTMAEDNRLLNITMPAPRGIIYDQYREALVQNTPSFEVFLKRGELPTETAVRMELAKNLGEALGMSVADLYEAGFDPDASPENLPTELVVASDVSREQVVDIESHSESLPGVFVRSRELRLYPGPAFSHIIGYAGKVGKENISESSNYSLSDIVGKDGLELFYDDKLRGENGEQIIEVNSKNIRLGELPQKDPVIGHSLVLNLDAGLQQTAYDALRRELQAHDKSAGSVVVLDPQNGAVRALVSIPGFDANIFRQRLSSSEYQKIFLSSDKPFFNRAVSGVYPSGSVIKPMVAVAALEEHVIDPAREIYDPGYITVPNPYQPGVETKFVDWRVQGFVNMRSAIQWSANVYFYIIGGGYKDIKGLVITKLGEYMKKFGFGSILGIDLPGEMPGLVPGPETLAKTRPRDPIWRVGDTYHVSIGQGDFLATPLQIAVMTAAVANGGTLWRPQIVNQILDENGGILESVRPEAIRTQLGDPASFKVVREGMRLVATEGTARAYFADFIVPVAGKTGTAQTGSEKNAHGWFTAFAPYNDPEVVVVVVAENVIANTAISTPVTRDILYWYFTEGKKPRSASGVIKAATSTTP